MGFLFGDHARNAERNDSGADISLRTVVRVAAIILIIFPFIRFAVEYWIAVGSFDGFFAYLPEAFAESGVSFLNSVIADPLRGFMFIALGTVTWWAAVGLPKRKKKR